ncbi:mCG1037845, partial [Mus musculus]
CTSAFLSSTFLFLTKAPESQQFPYGKVDSGDLGRTAWQRQAPLFPSPQSNS